MLKCNLFTVLVLIHFPWILNAQEGSKHPVPYNEEEKIIEYEEVIKIPGADKTELFKRTVEWGKSYYTNVRSKITKKDKEKGIYVLNGHFRENPENFGSTLYKYKLEVKFKDGKYKYRIYKLHIDKGHYFGLERWLKPTYQDPETARKKLEIVNTRVNDIIEALKNYMANPPEEKKEDW